MQFNELGTADCVGLAVDIKLVVEKFFNVMALEVEPILK